MNLLQATLGILTSMGGFIDIGELVFNSQAGARFGYNLMWAVLVSAIIIGLYAEMCGRVAIVTKRPVFELVKEKLGFNFGLCVLIASNIINILTCAAEIGGLAFILRLLTGLSFGTSAALVIVALILIVWIMPFSWLEKLFGIGGLFMFIFIAAVVASQPNWGSLAQNLIPHLPTFHSTKELLLYLYFAVGIINAGIMPYEVYFYSSGQVEEKKTPKDLPDNTMASVVGFTFGSIFSLALIILSAQLFMPHGIDPQLVGTAALAPAITHGSMAQIAALLGIFFAIGGAAIETCFAGSYNFTQFFNWNWGKQKKPLEVPKFTLTWLFIFATTIVILITGVDPVLLTEYAVIFSVLVLPFTYLPILLTAKDKDVMKIHTNSKWVNILAWIFFIIIIIVAASSVPLLFLTNAGQG